MTCPLTRRAPPCDFVIYFLCEPLDARQLKRAGRRQHFMKSAFNQRFLFSKSESGTILGTGGFLKPHLRAFHNLQNRTITQSFSTSPLSYMGSRTLANNKLQLDQPSQDISPLPSITQGCIRNYSILQRKFTPLPRTGHRTLVPLSLNPCKPNRLH